MRDQKGVSLVEILVAMLVLSFGVAVLMKSMDAILIRQTKVRNDLRAATLLRGKLEGLKDHARRLSDAGSFKYLTLSPMVVASSVTQVAMVDKRAFTWSVSGTFVSMSAAGVVAPLGTSFNAYAYRMVGLVTWGEAGFSKISTGTAQPIVRYVSRTVIVSDSKQR